MNHCKWPAERGIRYFDQELNHWPQHCYQPGFPRFHHHYFVILDDVSLWLNPILFWSFNKFWEKSCFSCENIPQQVILMPIPSKFWHWKSLEIHKNFFCIWFLTSIWCQNCPLGQHFFNGCTLDVEKSILEYCQNRISIEKMTAPTGTLLTNLTWRLLWPGMRRCTAQLLYKYFDLQ